MTVVGPGFPVGGGVHPLGGHGPPTRALFGENVCKNERIGSHGGGGGGVRPARPLDPPMHYVKDLRTTVICGLINLRTCFGTLGFNK